MLSIMGIKWYTTADSEAPYANLNMLGIHARPAASHEQALMASCAARGSQAQLP
jgi:hypothetical protein